MTAGSTGARAGTDSGLLSPVRAGTPGEAATSDEAWLQAMLDAEAALTRAQAGIGTVPKEAAETVTRVARAEALDLRALALASREAANPVVSLVAALARAVADVSPEAAEYVHRGSTSQDILDTGAMLVAARTLELIAADLAAAAESLALLAREHRDTVMPGRTLALQAVPTTFGLKAAGWRRLLLDAHQRIVAVLDGGLPVSLGGAAGTLAGYLEYALVDGDERAGDTDGYVGLLLDGFAAETGLARPPLPWHSLRTPSRTSAPPSPSPPARSARSRSTSRRSAGPRSPRSPSPPWRGAAPPPPCRTSATRCWPR